MQKYFNSGRKRKQKNPEKTFEKLFFYKRNATNKTHSAKVSVFIFFPTVEALN